jgi:F-type H+-transporting ATPase subunit delta
MLTKKISLAGRYAKSLHDLAYEQKIQKFVMQDFNSLIATINQNEILDKIFKNRYIKKTILFEIVIFLSQQFSFSKIFLNFLKVLIQNRSLKLIKKIYLIFTIIEDLKNGVHKFHITHANPLNQKTKKLIEGFIASFLAKKNIIEYQKDEKILGGFIINTQNIQIDSSVKYNIDLLSKKLKRVF